MAETEGIRLFDLKSESVASTSVETVSEIAKSISCLELELEVTKKEESFREETIHREADIPQIRVNLAVDNVQFRYMSEITEKKKKKSRQNSVADVMFENYHGYATVIAYCVDCDDKVHPYYLYGDNCKDGVYVKTSKLEQEKSVMIQGVYVCTPRIVDYQTRIDSTRSKLVENGITDVEKCDEKTVDKQCVYLKVVVVLGESTKKLSVTTTALQNKKNLKVKDVQSDHATIPGQKRTSFDCSQKNDVKRRRKSIANNKGDAQPRFFQRFYSRPDTEQPWGNFIDTAGYQESALTWKAQGEALHSVCMICYPGGCATGFRVGTGKNYIMTAAHVCRFILQSERGRVGWTTRNALKNPDVFAAFDYLKEGELKEKKKFHFKEQVHFTNDELDTAVLELEEHPDGTPMPPPLKYFQQPDFTKEFFFIGHSEGKPLAINKVDKVVDMQSDNAKQDIINIRNLSLLHTVSQEYPNGRGYELEPYHTLENQHRYLFHCKFTQGASGSPGLVFLNDGRKVVVSMLLCGYPVWYYDPDMEKFRTNWSKDCHCVEQGVNLSSVHALMSKENPELCNDIFCQ
ncbi:uncharacterized protein LOC123563542 [Mercenaria mercenaria]|uniref:uncharacterized protein LOC123563542 n=1 Tax=Mercenaria mercenaria TaxID=6596 RepID=UPI00234ED2EF|nr:uncharacterized protein LOC123563542 [Mercenaria mercenaria]